MRKVIYGMIIAILIMMTFGIGVVWAYDLQYDDFSTALDSNRWGTSNATNDISRCYSIQETTGGRLHLKSIGHTDSCSTSGSVFQMDFQSNLENMTEIYTNIWINMSSKNNDCGTSGTFTIFGTQILYQGHNTSNMKVNYPVRLLLIDRENGNWSYDLGNTTTGYLTASGTNMTFATTYGDTGAQAGCNVDMYADSVEINGKRVELDSPMDDFVFSSNESKTFTTELATYSTLTEVINNSLNVWFSNGTLFVTNVTTGLSGNITRVTNVLDSLVNFNTYYWNSYGCFGNATFNECSWDFNNHTLSNYIVVNVLGGGNLLDNVQLDCSAIGLNETFSESYQSKLESITNGTYYRQVSCTIRDLDYVYNSNTTTINFSKEQQEYNITMNSKGANLYFKYFNGTDAQVQGYYSDLINTTNFTGTSIIKGMTTMAQGLVRFLFAINNSGIENYTQFYEFDNNWVTDYTDNLTVLETADTTAYVKIIDESGRPLEGVTIRTSHSPVDTGGNYSLIGQRLTDSTGKTFFYFDYGTDAKLIMSKDGYSTKEYRWNTQDESYTSDSPLSITLQRSASGYSDNLQLWTLTWFSDRTKDIGMVVYSATGDSIKYNTNYRIGNSQSNKTFDLESSGLATEYLISGTDFADTGTSDITIHVWVDDVYWGSWTIDYQVVTTDIAEEPVGLDSDVRNKLLWIGLLLLSGILGILIKTENEVGGDIFLGGCVLLLMISWTAFSWLGVTALVIFALKIVRRYVAE